MNKIPFQKLHGFGNDYIVVRAEDIRFDEFEFARAACHRTLGIGGDGIAILEETGSTDSDMSCRIINPDGSEAAFSGNGTRCAVASLYHLRNWDKDHLRLDTPSGVKQYEFLRNEGRTYWFEAEIGTPVFNTDEIPFNRANRTDPDIEFTSDELVYRPTGATFPYVVLNVGNPVCAIFVDEFDPVWRTVGAIVEDHPCFPQRTNVVFVKPVDESTIEVRIWERGAGETSSSGRVR